MKLKPILLILAIATLWYQGTHAATARRPNIIYLMADDQNLESVGCYGNPEVQTPEMDRLGQDGVIFDRHYNTTAICMASRANVFTGMYEYKTGTNFSHGDMKPEVWSKSYPMLLREAGYLTAFAGKFGLLVEGRGLCESDFDIWGGAPGQSSFSTAKNKSMVKYADEFPHATLSYGAFGRDVIREAVSQDKPFCLSISFKAPHRPVTPDPQFDHVYDGKKFTKPANFGRENGEHLSAQSKQGRQYTRFTEWNYDTDYDGVMAKYYQLIYAIDVALGMIRQELDDQGIADNTVIVYTSDNGYIAGAHGFGSKVLPMEESSRVPLMILDPRSASAGKRLRSGALTGNIDFAPTLLDLAGVAIPANMDGVSLRPLLENPDENVRQKLALMNVWGELATMSLSVVTKKLKYTYWWYGDDRMEPAEELFNLEQDPLELRGLATHSDSASELQMMRKLYDQELAAWKDQAVPYNDYQRFGVLFDRAVPLADKNTSRVRAKR